MKKFGSSAAFLVDKNIEWQTVGEGIKRKIMGYDDSLMMVYVSFEKGAIGTPHNHYHSQVTTIVQGSFEVLVDGVKKILNAGDCFFAIPNVTHGVVCLEAGLLIDVFSPIREDFMENKSY